MRRVNSKSSDKMSKTMEEALRRALGKTTHAKIADACNLGRTAVSMWKRVPPKHVIAVEKLTGVSRHELRPDVFGEKKTLSEAA